MYWNFWGPKIKEQCSGELCLRLLTASVHIHAALSDNSLSPPTPFCSSVWTVSPTFTLPSPVPPPAPAMA
eukprot:CAMPEP_0174372338 /NCGR_PEP_ID=MMETSP0811_2-20130205/103277_1 /TAXON_ID=73025 ORGANISM="Eutreptiella gymnastica-like, Strain CCMP1594" /NCGR_SAMPLE_ID=MMETSP0811_2 /ASSEMBLY_ACC=CAM_ASM_000667 /LENGTH=69 /DNA_ID=CAMNT_0015519665 /DNA_START=353 /DNA_END=559 /DNA_ORIENTATION=-